jgi:copper chaperone NosL
MKPKRSFSPLSRILLVISAISLVISLFVPNWRIDLQAPQYPEGLNLLIYADKLGGNVDIINGLNHYIGMATLHSENFVEFTVLPYIIGGFALLSLIGAVAGSRKYLYVLFTLFALFGVVAMVDFWRWEYNYGHNLDPNAAIIVPGQAYQPPLIGFKQLLNFGAYSIPDKGGWLFIGSGVLMLLAVLYERGIFARFSKHRGKQTKKKAVAVAAVLLTLFFVGCARKGPEPVKVNADNCDYCKMTIADLRFAAELITDKGRLYKFDDASCLQRYTREGGHVEAGSQYVSDFTEPHPLVEAAKAHFVTSDEIASPMGGNTAAFSSEERAKALAEKLNASVKGWQQTDLVSE